MANAVKRSILDLLGLTVGTYNFEQSPAVSMVWKDAATITIQAGRYYIGGKLLNLSSNTDWSWTLDTGSEAKSTWYHMYLYNNSGTPTSIASTIAPTGRFNTNLNGTTYDVNIYLGSFYNNAAGASGDIVNFIHNKNKFLYVYPQSMQSTNNAAFQAKTAQIPTVANIAIVSSEVSHNLTESDYGSISSDGVNDYMQIDAGNISSSGSGGIKHYIEIPISTSQTLYIKLTVGGVGIYFWTLGWYDKWL